MKKYLLFLMFAAFTVTMFAQKTAPVTSASKIEMYGKHSTTDQAKQTSGKTKKHKKTGKKHHHKKSGKHHKKAKKSAKSSATK